MADKEEKEFQAMLKRLGVEMPAKSKKKTTKPKRKGGTPAKPKYRDGGRFNTIEKELKKYGGDPVNYKFDKGNTLTTLVDEILTAPKEIKDRVSRELLSTYEDIKPIFKQRKKALEEMGVTGKQFDTPRKFSPRNPIGARRAERAYGEELKDLVNKTTQGLSKGGSVKKNKSLYTRKGPCK
jgi:hypothetical protein